MGLQTNAIKRTKKMKKMTEYQDDEKQSQIKIENLPLFKQQRVVEKKNGFTQTYLCSRADNILHDIGMKMWVYYNSIVMNSAVSMNKWINALKNQSGLGISKGAVWVPGYAAKGSQLITCWWWGSTTVESE